MAKQNTNLICPLIIHMILELTTTKKSSKVFTCPWHFNKEWCIKKLSKLNTFFVQPTNHIGICWFLFLCIGLFKLQTVHIKEKCISTNHSASFFEYSPYFLETFLSKAFDLQWPPVISRENFQCLKILTQRQMSTSVIEVSWRGAWYKRQRRWLVCLAL